MRIALWLLVASSMACASGDERSVAPAAANATLKVYTVNYPLQYFAERIGGDRVDVRFPAPADGDPAFWRPRPEVIAAYQKADLILLNGAGYAKWVERVSLPVSRLVDTSASFHDRLIVVEDAVVHRHGPEGEHSHGGAAFTTWIDPVLALAQARAIRDALVAARPEHEASFQDGFAALEHDLKRLDERLEKVFAGKGDTPLAASHPVYQYLARRYGLSLLTVHFEPDTFPDEAGWHELEHLVEERPVETMLWEKEPLSETAARLEEMGIAITVFDPCSNRPGSGNYLTVMETNLASLEEVFAPPPGE